MLGVALGVAGLSACGYPPLPRLDGGMSTVGDGMRADAPTDGVAANCSIVMYCDASGTEGTRCVQQGCSLVTAQNECKLEARSVCGTIICPFIFATTTQEITLNCDGASCGANTVACNGKCCAAGVHACDSSGACCATCP